MRFRLCSRIGAFRFIMALRSSVRIWKPTANGRALIVVSYTSPVLNLARIGRLDLLPTLYAKVVIPSAVYVELLSYRSELPGLGFESAQWLVVLLIDEKRGRRIAVSCGLRVTGLLGVVARAKQTGVIALA